MAGGDISRNIPASRRHLLLDLRARLAPWPGEGLIRARNSKDGTQASYEGVAGRLSITIARDEDFEQKLVALERMVDHHIDRARMVASLHVHKTNPDTGKEWIDGSTDTPDWAWVVPDCLRLAVEGDRPGAVRNRIQDQLARAVTAWTGRDHTEKWSDTRMRINPHPSVGGRPGFITLFSLTQPKSTISWNTGRYYLRLPPGSLPNVAPTVMIGTMAGRWMDHPLIDPRTIITWMKRENGDDYVILAKQCGVLAPAPLQELDEVLEVARRMDRR